MSKRSYQVTLPIAGHAFLTVEAESEERALEIAFEQVMKDDIQEWEALEAFHEGNICYCPHPWEAEVEDEGEVEDGE